MRSTLRRIISRTCKLGFTLVNVQFLINLQPPATLEIHPPNQTQKIQIPTHNPKTIPTRTKRRRCSISRRVPTANCRSGKATTFNSIIRSQMTGGELASTEKSDSLLTSSSHWKSSNIPIRDAFKPVVNKLILQGRRAKRREKQRRLSHEIIELRRIGPQAFAQRRSQQLSAKRALHIDRNKHMWYQWCHHGCEARHDWWVTNLNFQFLIDANYRWLITI